MSHISYKHFIYDHELTLYPYAPLGLLHNNGEWPESKYNLSIIASASIENLNIIEWISYHQALGIDHIYLYCTDNDPTDLYRLIMSFTLGKKPFITFHHYRFSNTNTQLYFHFIRNYLHETAWYINLDVVDYLYIHEKQSVPAFLNSFVNINAVYFNMVLYNGNDAKELNNKQTIFQKNIPLDYPCIFTKLMIRSRSCPYQYIFENLDKKIDHHIQIETLTDHSCNVLHQNMRIYYENFPSSAIEYINYYTQEQILSTAYIAHFCKSNDTQENLKNLSALYANNDISAAYNNHNPAIILQNFTPEQYWQKTQKKVWQQSFLPTLTTSLSVISENKPCQQSSAPTNNTTQELAGNLIRQQLRGITQTITQPQTDPWWEIDLQEPFIIKNIRLFNGLDPNIKNMKSFIIESSEDHEIWIKRHQNTNKNLFGGVDGSYYNWMHPLGIKARWIRITVPGDNQIFSLDQIQILGVEYKQFNII